MTSPLGFTGSYLTFVADARPYQRADDVGFAVTEFMWFEGRPYYPIGALAEARIASTRLSSDHFDPTDEDNLDLIFQMREAGGGHFFEVVLRSNRSTAYGGWLWGRDLEILDEFVDGYRVISTTHNKKQVRFEYRRTFGRYEPVGPAPVEKAAMIVDRQKPLTHNLACPRLSEFSVEF